MIQKAVAFATKAHSGAVRKGTVIPYITHPLEAAVIVSMITNDEEMIAAALLHDVIEDAGVTWQDLEKEFGSRVASLVWEETEDKTKSWHERKAATIEHLRHASLDVKIITLGDKLSNMRCTARDYLAIGDAIWNRFNEKRKPHHKWYYENVARELKELAVYPSYQEYLNLCRFVFGDMNDYLDEEI